MKLDLKYVTARRNADGSLRHYWQRAGEKLVRLPEDPVERYAVALRLNAEADGRKPAVPSAHRRHGTVAWLVDGYENSDDFTDLAHQTRVSYRTWLRRIETLWGDLPAGAVTRGVVLDWVETIAGRSNRKLAGAVLSQVLGRGYDRGVITNNPALRLGIKAPDARDQYFTDRNIDRWMEVAADDRLGDRMQVAFWLLLYTGQRPRDCLAMPKTRYDGKSIKVRQQKTHKLMRVPAHQDLRAVLDADRHRLPSTLICGGLTYRMFNMAWNRIATVAGLGDLQARDVRRTAVVQLAEAGCTDIEISSITGHSITDIKSILDSVYLVRTDAMAESAVSKWQARQRT